MSKKKKDPMTLPKDTPAFLCADCGAASLAADNICKPQGRGTRADWCGTKSGHKPKGCRKDKHTHRFKCKSCGQVAVNPELLCKPLEMGQD